METDKKKDEPRDLKEGPVKNHGVEESVSDQPQSLHSADIKTDQVVAERAEDKDETTTVEAAAPPGAPSERIRNRQPSLSLQSQLRSSNFRRTSVSQAPVSPAPADIKSLNLPVLTPEGDSINEIYRKQTSRLDELEKENKRLAKEVKDVRLRWEKAEEELEDLRESSAELADLRMRAAKVDAQTEEIERLVRSFAGFTSVSRTKLANTKAEA